MSTIFIALFQRMTQPPDILHDPNSIALMGVGVGIAAIIASILVGIYQVQQGRTQRKLEYHLISNSPILAINSIVANQVEIDISIKGIPVKDAHLIVLLIKNSGKVSIRTTDYFEPLTFEFDARVLSASILETIPPALVHPQDISTFLTLSPQSIQFPTFPLNPNDTVQISILLENKGKMRVRGRLDQGNIKSFELENNDITANTVTLDVGLVIIIGAVLSVLFAGLAALGTVLGLKLDIVLGSRIGLGVGITLGVFVLKFTRKRTRIYSPKKL